jgi:predicted CopG family antitoxin
MNFTDSVQGLSKRTTVSLDIEVYNRLRSKGKFGESFSQLVSRVLEDLDQNKASVRE